MSAPDHLLTRVDLAESAGVTARLSLVLADGTEVVLLDDRGWSGVRVAVHDDGTRTVTHSVGANIARIEDTARTVVGPDEPFDDHTPESMAREHWDALAGRARDAGVDVTGQALAGLRHDVELTERVRAAVDRS